MARKPRIHYSGALYHVMLRGNGGMDLFGDDQDRYRFFLLLQEGVERFGFQVVAYCLMDNHFLCGAPHKRCYVKRELM
jgi:REP element-mobilizing transposase RayT